MTTRRQEQSRPAPVTRTPRFQFIREVISELRKVVWPTREDAWRLTIMVIAISAVVGVLLGGIDILFSFLIRTVLVG